MKLIICEKHISAQKIATILSNGKAKMEKIKGTPVFVFDNSAIIGLRGHIFNLDFPKQYNYWQGIKPRDLIKVVPIKISDAIDIINALKDLAKKTEEVIVATDYDREGELIGVEGLNVIKQSNPNIKFKRAKFSALTHEEVKKAFENLQEVDFNLSDSAEARQKIDLVWGASLTRFISLASEQLGKDFLSVGRVQSPTLALIVDREKEILNFVPTPYWEIIAELEKGIKFSALHNEGRIFEKEKAEKIFANVRSVKEGEVINVNQEEKSEKPPAPFNTTAFLQSATQIGFSVANAMKIAEDLYTSGYISYPRTDNTVYPPSLNLKSILQKLTNSELGEFAKEILQKEKLIPTKGRTISTDHPPIHPVEGVKKKDLKEEQWKIYELILRRFYSTLADECISLIIKVDVSINNEIFSSEGYRILKEGWRRYYHYYSVKEISLPELGKGDIVSVLSVNLLGKKTQPPKRYSQGTLIAEMERIGLGTKSTRHEIIQKLFERKYVHGMQITPTKTGFVVTDSLEKHANIITSAEMTSTLEKDMDEIAEGKKRLNEVVEESQKMLEDAIIVLEKHGNDIGSAIKNALREQSVIGKCPKCSFDLMIKKSKDNKRFVGCSNYPNCTQTFSLPQKGIIQRTEENCEKCSSPIITLIERRRKTKLCLNFNCETNKERREKFEQYKRKKEEYAKKSETIENKRKTETNEKEEKKLIVGREVKEEVMKKRDEKPIAKEHVFINEKKIVGKEQILKEEFGKKDDSKQIYKKEQKSEFPKDEVKTTEDGRIIIGKCPNCNCDLLIKKSKNNKRFVGCSNYPKCAQSYPLPQEGRVIPLNENCGYCSSPIVKIITKGRNPWTICLNMNCKSKEKKF